MILSKRKSQSILDYTLLIAIACVSLLAISGWIYRSINQRMGHVWTDLYHPLNGVR